jgi:adenine-specific DNA-methyltransferase
MSSIRHLPLSAETIFISGSRSIKSLPSSAREQLDHHMANGSQFLVGDAPGTDLLVQQYLAHAAYSNVTVFHIGQSPRNNLGFPSQRVQGTKQTDKDIFMAKAADRGLAIWDGKSPGTKQNIARLPTNVITASISTRGEAARADIVAQSSDDFRSLYNVPEGLTRGQHTSALHHLDQFARDEFERGATVTDSVLSIPRDPDSHTQNNSNVKIGTESHAIRFVSSFVKDPDEARAKGCRLYELGEKACGQWTDTHGRWLIFTNLYDLVRKDENGQYRTHDQKAAAVEQVLNSIASWADQLPEPVPEPTAEQVHQYTLELAEENRLAPATQEVAEPLSIDRLVESDPRLLYLHELQTNSHGLATIGELTGFALQDSAPDSTHDENQIYSELFENAVLDAMDLSATESDHLGAERIAAGPALDATFERVNLDALPPAIPQTVSEQTQATLLTVTLPAIDAQIDRGISRNEILSAIYQENRANELQRFSEQIARAFGAQPENERSPLISRQDQLQALTSLRLLLAAEYKRETRSFSREAVDWAKANYSLDPEQLRAAGKLKVGEFATLINDQASARSQWQMAYEGQQVPYRAQINRITQLETAGHKVNSRITALNPSREELLNALHHAHACLQAAVAGTKARLTAFTATDTQLRDVDRQAAIQSQTIRASEQFAAAKSTFTYNEHERAIDEQQAVNRGNNARFSYLSPADKHPSTVAQLKQDHQVESRTERLGLINSLIDPAIEAQRSLLADELRACQIYFTQLAGREIVTPAEARETLQSSLSSLNSLLTVTESSISRLNAAAAVPAVIQDLTPAPIYVSLVSNEHLRVPVTSLPEYDALTNAIRDCRLETSTWRSLSTTVPVTGRDEERDAVTAFIGDYIGFRQSDYFTAELSHDRMFREYAQRINDTRTTDELVETVLAISKENFENYQRAEANKADPNYPAPDKPPLDLQEMRQLFLTVTPAVSNKSTRAQMRDVLLSTVFGKDKTDRVQLLAEGKIKPSQTLARLFDNLAARSTIAAVNHFYASLRNPAPARANSFNLYEAHRSLAQYERDFLHQRALAAKYESFKTQNPSAQPARTAQLPLVSHTQESAIATNAKATASYRSYYGQADWLEAKLCAAALAEQNGALHQSHQHSIIAPEFSDLEVRAINYAVHNFDKTRQSQVVEHLRGTDDLHNQTLADMFSLAADAKRTGATQPLTRIDIQLPINYSVSSESAQKVVNFTLQHNQQQLDPQRAAQLRQEAQRDTWNVELQNILRDPSLFVDAPVKALDPAKEVRQFVSSAAVLQERARTAFTVRDSHFNSCVNRAAEALRAPPSNLAKGRLNFAPAIPRQTVSELVHLVLNQNRSDSKGLLNKRQSQVATIKAAIPQAELQKADELHKYAVTARDEYLQTFAKLDTARTALQLTASQLAERLTAEYNATHQPSTASERYTTVKDTVERQILGEHLAHALADNQKELSSTTNADMVRDLLPPAILEQSAAAAREQAWQSFEPQEIGDANAGQVVDERLLNVAYNVMDQVDLARHREEGVRQAEASVNLFLDHKSQERGTSDLHREAVRRKTISQRNGPDAARYQTLQKDVLKADTRLAEAFQQIDSTLELLDVTRTELRVERQMAPYQQIAAPAAERINAYLKDTAKEEGIKSVVEPLRHEAHVERIALTILQTARDCNVQLDHSPEGLAQVHNVATNLFNTLRDGLERANHHLLQGRELLAEPYRWGQLITNQTGHHQIHHQNQQFHTHDHMPAQVTATLDKNTAAVPDRILDLTLNPELLRDNPFYEQDLTNSLDLNQSSQMNNGGSQATALTQNHQTQERETYELDLVL